MAAILVPSAGVAQQSLFVAKVIVQQGQVSAVKDTNNYRALSLGSTVTQGQLIVTGHDGYAKFQVEDGSTFEVFPDAQVIFRNTMSFGDLLNVVIGKIKVYIQHAPGIPNPNNVTTPTALISVRGTVFFVDVQDDDGTTTVSVDDGMVAVRNLKMGGKTVTLIPGQAITVDPRAPLVGLGGQRGGVMYKVVRMAQDAIRDGLIRPGGTTPGGIPSGGTTAPSGGQQGDKGKPTGSTTGTGSPTGGTTGTGSPTGGTTGTGSPTGSGGTPPPGGGGA
jgi:hypothetical protein